MKDLPSHQDSNASAKASGEHRTRAFGPACQCGAGHARLLGAQAGAKMATEQCSCFSQQPPKPIESKHASRQT
eukprot:3625830-Lingulodinium_polyedra.AAC.1